MRGEGIENLFTCTHGFTVLGTTRKWFTFTFVGMNWAKWKNMFFLPLHSLSKMCDAQNVWYWLTDGSPLQIHCDYFVLCRGGKKTHLLFLQSSKSFLQLQSSLFLPLSFRIMIFHRWISQETGFSIVRFAISVWLEVTARDTDSQREMLPRAELYSGLCVYARVCSQGTSKSGTEGALGCISSHQPSRKMRFNPLIRTLRAYETWQNAALKKNKGLLIKMGRNSVRQREANV